MFLGSHFLILFIFIYSRSSKTKTPSSPIIFKNMNDEQQALLDYTTLHPLELPFTQRSVDVGLRRGDTSWPLDHIMFYSDEKVISDNKEVETTTITGRFLPRKKFSDHTHSNFAHILTFFALKSTFLVLNCTTFITCFD